MRRKKVLQTTDRPVFVCSWTWAEDRNRNRAADTEPCVSPDTGLRDLVVSGRDPQGLQPPLKRGKSGYSGIHCCYFQASTVQHRTKTEFSLSVPYPHLVSFILANQLMPMRITLFLLLLLYLLVTLPLLSRTSLLLLTIPLSPLLVTPQDPSSL